MPITSPNMNLIVPIPSSGVTGTGDTGPGYAVDISNDLLTTIDQHNHTSGNGVQIPSAGLTINADLTIQQNNLTNIRASRYTSQSAALSGVGDVSELYVANGNLYFNNSSGTPIQLTIGNQINTNVVLNALTYQAITSSWTILSTDNYILMECETSLGSFAIQLPAANSVSQGRWFVITDGSGSASNNNITITTAGSDKIQGQASYSINTNFGSVIIASNGNTTWDVLSTAQTAVYQNGTPVGLAQSLNLLGGLVGVQGPSANQIDISRSGWFQGGLTGANHSDETIPLAWGASNQIQNGVIGATSTFPGYSSQLFNAAGIYRIDLRVTPTGLATGVYWNLQQTIAIQSTGVASNIPQSYSNILYAATGSWQGVSYILNAASGTILQTVPQLAADPFSQMGVAVTGTSLMITMLS